MMEVAGYTILVGFTVYALSGLISECLTGHGVVFYA